MSRYRHGGCTRCECDGTCNRAHTGPCENTVGSNAAGSRYPTRLVLRGDRVLCVGCTEPYDPTKRWRYPSAY
jgi:hypothetical protein